MDQPKIQRMLRLMALLSSQVEYTVDELAERLDMSQRTIYRYIDTFREAGFSVEKVRDYVYRLTTLREGVADLSDIVYFSPEEAYIVNRLIDAQVEEGYFKECPITFRDIAYAKTVLIEKLKTIYHTRISYPELKK